MTDKPESFEEIVAEIRARRGSKDSESLAGPMTYEDIDLDLSRLEAERARSGRVNVAALRGVASSLSGIAKIIRLRGDTPEATAMADSASAIESALTGRFDDEEKEAMKAGAFWLSDEVIGSHESRKKWAATLRRMLDEEGS